MNRVFYAVVLFCVLAALKPAECVISTTAEELTYAMQNDMKEKGPRCTSGVVDMLFLEGASWAVRCSAYGERFIDVEAALTRNGPFTKLTIWLLPSGRMRFKRQNGVYEDQYSRRGQTVYLVEKYDDDNGFWRARYNGMDWDFYRNCEIPFEPPKYRRWNNQLQKWEVD